MDAFGGCIPVNYFHAFCLLVMFLFQNCLSGIFFSGIPSVPKSLNPDLSDILSRLIWVETVWKCYQHKTPVDKELKQARFAYG